MVDEILRTAGANDLSTIPSETPHDPLDRRNGDAPGESTFMHGTQNTHNESRRLFEASSRGGETPIARKGPGLLDHWQESAEGSQWL